MILRSIRPGRALACCLASSLVFVLLLAGTAPTALAQDWAPELTAQVLREYDCEVAFLSQVSERTVNGDIVVLAKVHCVDERTFDAYRDSAFKAFEIHPCENPNNRVC